MAATRNPKVGETVAAAVGVAPLAVFLLLVLASAGCSGPEADGGSIDAVHVRARSPVAGQVVVELVGGAEDEGTLTGVGESWPFKGRLAWTVLAGASSSPQYAGGLSGFDMKVVEGHFAMESEAAANDLFGANGGEPLFGSDDVWRLRITETVPDVQCGGFYVVRYDLDAGRSFTGDVDFRGPAC